LEGTTTPEQIIAAMREIVENDRVLTADEADRRGFLVDPLGKHLGRPACLVEPISTLEVSAVAKRLSVAGIPIVPMGGNTGLAGGAVIPDRAAVMISMRRMDGIEPIPSGASSVAVDSGCILANLQMAARAADRLFPLSLTAEGSCQIGGTIATNAGGINALRYGTMRDLVLGLEVVLADGRILDMMRSLRKDNAGYDLKHLFIGSGGTLGIVTRAVLRLFPKVTRSATAMVAIRDAACSLRLLADMREMFGERLTSCELIDRASLALVLRHDSAARSPFADPPAFVVLLQLDGNDADAGLETDLEEFLATKLECGLCDDAVVAQSSSQSEALWHLRHALGHVLRHAGLRFSHDISVPVEAQADYVEEVVRSIARSWPEAIVRIYGHLGDGNLHTIICFPDRKPSDDPSGSIRRQVDDVIDGIVMAFGGSVTAEHGIGSSYIGRLVATRSSDELNAMRAIKTALDPDDVMNPGKIFAL